MMNLRNILINNIQKTLIELQITSSVGLAITTAKWFCFWTSFAVRSKSRKYWTTWTGNLYEYGGDTITALLVMIRCISFQIYRLRSNTRIYKTTSLKRGRRFCDE